MMESAGISEIVLPWGVNRLNTGSQRKKEEDVKFRNLGALAYGATTGCRSINTTRRVLG